MDASFEEVERGPASRVYKVRFPAEHVAPKITARLNELGKNVRLPGFRPGKIPEKVLVERYGAKARAEVLQKLAAEATDSVLAKSELASAIELAQGSDAGDVEFRLSVTHLPELAPIDFAAITLERLIAPTGALESHLRQQVLDHLDAMYSFPLAPALIAGEYARISKQAEQELASTSITEAEREEIAAELQRIAERRVRLGAVVSEMGRRYEVAPSVDEIRAARQGAESPEQTRNRLLEDRLIQLILSKAQVTERAATEQELREL